MTVIPNITVVSTPLNHLSKKKPNHYPIEKSPKLSTACCLGIFSVPSGCAQAALKSNYQIA
jgi:hypothetical protein